MHAPEVDRLIWDFTLAAEQRPEVISSSSLINTMAKIIQVPGGSNMTPLPEEMIAAADAMPPDIAKALLAPDSTATQVNLRLAQASLEERADLVDELQADLDARIEALEITDTSSPLLLGIDSANAIEPVRADAEDRRMEFGLEKIQSLRSSAVSCVLSSAATTLGLRWT